MSITNVYRIPNETANQTQTSYEEKWHYLVTTDAVADGASVVRDASFGGITVPTVGQVFSGLRVASKDISRDQDEPNVWRIDLRLSSNVPELTSGSGESPGEKWNVNLSLDGVPYEEVVYRDRLGKSIVNAAGMTFDPQPTAIRYDEEIRVAFRTNVVDIDAITNARGKVNNGPVTMNIRGMVREFPAETLMLATAPCRTRIAEGEDCWDVEYVFHHRADTWARKILNQGLQQKVSGKPKPVPCRDEDGVAVSEPVLLNADGTQAVPLRDSEVTDFLTFHIKEPADFSPLFLGL